MNNIYKMTVKEYNQQFLWLDYQISSLNVEATRLSKDNSGVFPFFVLPFLMSPSQDTSIFRFNLLKLLMFMANTAPDNKQRQVIAES